MTSQNKIPFFNYPSLFKEQETEIMATLRDVLSRGAYILQKELEDFEKTLASFTSAKHAIGVANGTDALIIALRAAGVGPGDEVILPSHTYIATAAAVYFSGATPILVECGSDHMLDPQAITPAITTKTKAIMPVQLNGRTCNMTAIQQIADEHGLLIIEDSAQALGSQFKGQCAGTFGAAGTISFYPAKLLGCFGDGGAVLTNDDAMAEKILLLRDHGRNQDGIVVDWGLNSRLDNVQAAVLNVKFKTYREDIARRREIASLYQKNLGDMSELKLPPAPDADPDHFDVYQNYEIEAERRNELMSYLKENGIHSIIQWAGTPVHQFKELGLNFNLPKTDALFEKCFLLPMNVSLTDDDIHRICQTIRSFYQN